MDIMLTNIPGKVAYLDDIWFVGRTDKEMLQRLNKVMENIIDYGLKINLEKSVFLRKINPLLGICGKRGRLLTRSRESYSIHECEGAKECARATIIMGWISYFSPFIAGLHKLQPPLNRLLCKDAKFGRSADCQEAFHIIKAKITESTVLSHFEADEETIVYVDASGYGLGSVLLQKDSDRKILSLMQVARALTKAERNYSQIENEALVIIFAVQKFNQFIYGRHFVFHTDHQPLKFLFGTNHGLLQYATKRIQRWSTILLSYDFTIQYVPTQNFGAPDDLSRLSVSDENQEDVVITSTLIQDDEEFRGVIRQVPLTAEHIRATTTADPL
ncbi:unnamed protein product [Schistocephalus solidus]|uniref:Reverse transcriptase domain-containing protein n=1 Tax=Schistocephalus solidus TaxID=70667 RepID=A0A183TCD5_SCHSO|nr:unnamed protein product [Schistocephalus solidus]